MADIKTKYPQASVDTIALTITLASLATDANLLAGRASTAIVNTSNLDLDHVVSGRITVGTSPTSGKAIEVWAYAPIQVSSGTPTYPDSITGTDANKTMTSSNVKRAGLRLVQAITVDSTSDRTYPVAATSIAQLFGAMPPWWGLFVVHDTAVSLNSTAGNHYLNYQRIQAQTV